MDTQSQSNLQNEITKHLCQAHAVQIKGLQTALTDVINQTTKALEEGQPELAHSLWKQVVQQTQNISRLFNQTTEIMYQQGAPGAGQYGRPQGRRNFNGYSGNNGRNNGRNRQQQNFPAKQLNRIARQVDELVAASN